LKFISIIIPCRNEESFIGRCLDSILVNDYPREFLEILVVDGMSDDQTRAIVHGYIQRYSWIRILDNPKTITPCALNIGIATAKGEVIMRMDAHSTYDREYISQCVQSMDQYQADNVGGVWKIMPRNNTLIDKAVTMSLSHRFGIGNAHYRMEDSKEPRWVDTVPFFCYKKEVFQKIGLFNEKLARGQDMEFNLRLKHARGRTLLVPHIVSYYYARSDMKSFVRHNWSNGVWAILPFLYTDVMPISWRHLVPLLFVSGVLGSAALAPLLPLGIWFLMGIGIMYFAANFSASVQVALRQKEPRYLLLMPFVFGALHFSYGLGSLWGLVRVIAHKMTPRPIMG
jgi:glycosyltransferase involved in cell wall biosynthesis